MTYSEQLLKISSLIIKSANTHTLKKAVLSKPLDTSIQKTVITARIISKKDALQAETLHKDNKAKHKNFFLDSLTSEILCEFLCNFKQINLITSLGECELRSSNSGKVTLLGDKKLSSALGSTDIKSTFESVENNLLKKHILDGSEPFLQLLGVSDEKGRVFDKKSADPHPRST